MPTPYSSAPGSTKQRPQILNDHLDKGLLTYMAAAGAAGVSVLAMTQSATAKVIYTPAHRTIVFGKSYLDLNNDGIPDFGFHSYGLGNVHSSDIFPIKFNKMMSYAHPLPAGVSVGPSGKFRGGLHEMVGDCFCSGVTYFNGPWLGVQNEYVGFEFNIKGAAHFGWARFSVTDTGEVTLTGYAYETVSLKPIVTGDTGGDDEDSVAQPGPVVASPQLQPSALGRPQTLGVLATGAAGLEWWRQ
jgi:hypothetical protein